ncbi:hypothetical protein N7540_012480 [Penicillium herquei]|nr:hypothetical protein N7540_012480 [Penicillium herquei]
MSSTSEDKVVLDRRSSWMLKIQWATELYRAGTKLWTKEDIRDIEQQLTNCCLMPRFSVRQLDGRIIEVVNPIYQVENPIWKPYVEFQEYWQLMHSPLQPEEYQSSYMVE